MIGKTLLLLALPIAGLQAQNSPITVRISHNSGEFRIVRSNRDSVEAPIFARGVLEYAGADARDPRAFWALEVVALDTLNTVRVEAMEGARVMASAEGRYLTIRREQSGIAIEARSSAPASVLRELRKP